MDEDREKRIARNEVAFRNVNEGIERGQWPGDEGARVAFRCECGQLGCNELIELTVREYEEVRASPRRFVMLPGHQIPEVETVVETFEGYIVVEKREESGRLAEAADPRP
jgi:hypothetical protein